jgi:hypothetical protein
MSDFFLKVCFFTNALSINSVLRVKMLFFLSLNSRRFEVLIDTSAQKS